MRLFKKQVSIGQYRIGALWGDYEPRFLDLIDSLFTKLPRLSENEKDDLILQLQDVVDNFIPGSDWTVTPTDLTKTTR